MLRFLTQPLPALVAGLDHAAALRLLRRLDEVAAREGIPPHVGSEMRRDGGHRAPAPVALRSGFVLHGRSGAPGHGTQEGWT